MKAFVKDKWHVAINTNTYDFLPRESVTTDRRGWLLTATLARLDYRLLRIVPFTHSQQNIATHRMTQKLRLLCLLIAP